MAVFTISAGNLDCEEQSNVTYAEGGWDVDGWTVGVRSGPTVCDAGLIFPNATIPQGATINSAYVTAFAKFQNGAAGSLALIWRGIAEDNPSAWTSGTRPSTRTKTTANVTQGSLSGVTDETNFQFSDITSIIQEIINRAGFASGNSIALVLEDNGGATDVYRQFNDYSNDSTHPATLTITYAEEGVDRSNNSGANTSPAMPGRALTGVPIRITIGSSL